MAKKKDFDFTKGSETVRNQRTVQALLKKPAADFVTESQRMDPPAGQLSLLEETTAEQKTGRKAGFNGEYRTLKKQLLFPPSVYENAKKRAEKANVSMNEYINILIANASGKITAIRREKKPLLRTRRTVTLFKPSVFKETDATAAALGTSFNDYVNYLLENAEKYEK